MEPSGYPHPSRPAANTLTPVADSAGSVPRPTPDTVAVVAGGLDREQPWADLDLKEDEPAGISDLGQLAFGPARL